MIPWRIAAVLAAAQSFYLVYLGEGQRNVEGAARDYLGLRRRWPAWRRPANGVEAIGITLPFGHMLGAGPTGLCSSCRYSTRRVAMPWMVQGASASLRNHR